LLFLFFCFGSILYGGGGRGREKEKRGRVTTF